MNLLTTNVSMFRRSSPIKSLPIYFVRNIIALILEGLAQLHDLNIVHTDVNPDNMLIGGAASDAYVDQVLADEPLVIGGEFELDGVKYPACPPQPIPHRYKWNSTPFEAEVIGVYLVDLGQAQWADRQPTVDTCSAPALRAPEIIIQSGFGPKIDIWAIGCITFELLTGAWLFSPEDGEEDRTAEDDHLAKMMELTGERFTDNELKYSQRRNEFFDKQNNLLRTGELAPGSLESTLANYKLLDAKEIVPAADFVHSCLHLDPFKRPSAKDLQLAPWLRSAFTC